MSEPAATPIASRTGSLKTDLVFNVGSQFFLRIVTALTALYAARFLGPEQFGAWAVLQVLFMYTAQGHMGTVNAMMREVPLCQTRGEHATAQRLVNSTWAFVSLSSIVVTGAAGAIVLWFYRPSQDHAGLVVLGSMWLVFVQLQSVFFQFYCRAYSSFKIMAAFSVSQAVLTSVLCLWLVPRLGIAGYLFALAVGFSLIPIAIVTRPGIRFGISVPDWRRLLGIGLPMLPGTLMLYLNMSLERLVLASTVSATAVGLFAAGAFFFQIGATLWELVIYTWYSRLAAIYGATGKVETLAAALRHILPGVVWVSSVIQGAAFVVLPFVLGRVLPGYKDSVAIAQVLILVMNLWGIGQFLGFALTIIGKQKRSLLLQGLFLVVKLALLAVVVVCWHHVVVVAVASAVALAFYVAITWSYWHSLCKAEPVLPASSVALWIGPVVVAVISAFRATGSESWQASGFRLLLYVLCMAAASTLVERKERMMMRMWAWRGAE